MAISIAIIMAIVVVPLSFFVLVVSSEEVNCGFIFSFHIIAYNIESLNLQYEILRINKNEIYIDNK
jgi:type III secretory pathway component EscU